MATTVTIFPNASRNPGTYVFTGNVPQGVVSARLAFDRSLWSNPAHTLDAKIEISEDGGTTWRPNGGFGDQGGNVTGLDGTPLAATFMQVELANPGIARRVRCTLTIAGGTFTTTGTLTLE